MAGTSSQAEGRGFESRIPLNAENQSVTLFYGGRKRPKQLNNTAK